MARDPNERRSSSLIEKADDMPPGVVLPPAVKAAGIGTGNGQYYAYRVIYANGRSEFEWYKRGAGGGPDNPDPVEMRTEAPPAADVKEKWDKEEQSSQTTAQRQQDQSERKRVSVTYEGAGSDRKRRTVYETGADLVEDAPETGASAAKEWRSEGTPTGRKNADGTDEYDNSRPMMAAYVNGKRTGETRQPTAKELEDWNLAGQMARNPGGKTDAEIQAQKDKDQANAARPGTKIRERTEIKDGKKVTVETWRLPDGTEEERTAEEPASAKDVTTTITRNGQTYIQHSVQKPDGTSEVYHTDQAGNRVTLPREGATKLPPGMPPLDTSSPDAAHRSYLAQQAWAQQAQMNGDLTNKEVVELLTPSHDAAMSVIEREQKRIENERAGRTQDIQQEGNRLSASTSQFANSRLGVDEALHYGPKGGNEAGSTWLNNLLVQTLMNQNTKGNIYPPTGPSGAVPPAAPLTNPNALSETGPLPGVPTTGYVTPEMAAPAPTGSAMLDNIAASAQTEPVSRGPQLGSWFTPTDPSRATVDAANAATMNGSQAAFGGLGVPPAPAPPAEPPVGAMDPATLPPMLRNMHARSVLEQILAGSAA